MAESWYSGVKAGVNIGEVYGDFRANSSGKRTLFAGGGLIGARFNAHLGPRLEVLYVQKGNLHEFEDPFSTQPVEVQTRIDYIELPLLFVASFQPGEMFHFDLFAGPAFDFQVHAESRFRSVTEDIGPVTSNFDFCGTFGAGIRYDLSRFSLVADGRYTLGTISTLDVDDVSGSVKNRGICLLAGIEFPLGSR